MKELSPLTWWMGKLRARLVSYSLEKVRMSYKITLLGVAVCVFVHRGAAEEKLSLESHVTPLFDGRFLCDAWIQRIYDEISASDLCLVICCSYPEFRELQRKSEFERAEWVRKQGKMDQNSVSSIDYQVLVVSITLFPGGLQVLTLSSTSTSLLHQNAMCC